MSPAARDSSRSRTRRRVDRRRAVAVAVGLVVCIGLLWGMLAWVEKQFSGVTPLPLQDQCVVAADGTSTSLTPEQAKYASIIVGVATQRGLAPRAGVIALATALQESGLRNLDYGDRDSVGLFQQRPSQGWGTEQQLMDPFYASNAFYTALEKVQDWETGDINDVAQEVQKSGAPEAYRKHVARATLVGSTLAGQGSGTIRCLDKTPGPGNAAAYVDLLAQTYAFTDVSVEGQKVSFDTRTPEGARALAFLAVAHTHDLGVASANVGDQAVQTGSATPLPWHVTTPAAASTHVVVTFRG